MRAYADTVRRTRFDSWFVYAPLWRAALAFYVLYVVAIYAGLGALHSPSGQHLIERADFNLRVLIGGALFTASFLIGRHLKRRRLGLTPSRRRRTDRDGE
jgi:hypothetical protein